MVPQRKWRSSRCSVMPNYFIAASRCSALMVFLEQLSHMTLALSESLTTNSKQMGDLHLETVSTRLRQSGVKARLVFCLRKAFMVALGSCYPSIFKVSNLHFIYYFLSFYSPTAISTSTFISIHTKQLLYYPVFIQIVIIGNMNSLIVDKENNANHINITMRRRRKEPKEEERPFTSIMEKTFNPLPSIKRVSIPTLSQDTQNILLAQQRVEARQEKEGRPKGKQGPVIVKSHKLRLFFGFPQDRYSERRKLSLNPRPLIRHSLGTISSKLQIKQTSQTLQVQILSSKKEQFASLYQKQKASYDCILKKYGIAAQRQDDEYIRFMHD